MKRVFLSLLLLLSHHLMAQDLTSGSSFSIDDDDLSVGGDIFTDFSDDLEATQVMEDERFYRYGRFFTFDVGVGHTTYDGNRGSAYENAGPTYKLALHYFNDFRSSFGLGFEYSKHAMFIGDPTVKFRTGGAGYVEVSMLRFFLGYRYYIETGDLGTAITYSNPYVTTRMEYWYQSNKYIDQPTLGNDSGGGLGFGFGGGLEFPIRLKESYLNIEFLYHTVNFFDKYTQAFRSPPDSNKKTGYEDMTGNVYSTIVSYVFNW